MNHEHHHQSNTNSTEYVKFAGIMLAIVVLSYMHAAWSGMSLMQYLESFMGVFFLVFALFKLSNLKEFAYGFQSYDILARRSLAYSYSYPFIQLIFALLYLTGVATMGIDFIVLAISLVSGVGVIRTLSKKMAVHCVCLGNVIKLPLSTISFVEDFGMAVMAIAMIILR